MRHKLSLFKILHRIYYTPEKLHRMNNKMSCLCWHCKRQKGNFYHMLWSCNLLSTFWNSVINIISLRLDIQITISPRLCRLGTGNMDPLNEFQKKYIDLALITAKKCITIHWKWDYPPTVSHWLNEISSYIPLDKIYYNLR